MVSVKAFSSIRAPSLGATHRVKPYVLAGGVCFMSWYIEAVKMLRLLKRAVLLVLKQS